MAVINVVTVNPVQAWQITGDASIWTVFNAVAAANYTSSVTCTPGQGGPQYSVLLQAPNMPAQQGGIGDWIVFDGAKAFIYKTAQFNQIYKAGP